jgi:parallel beta-helix repeat protein
MKYLFSIAFFFSIFSVFADDITIYVSPNGKGIGSFQSPATLEQAVAMIPDLKKNHSKGTITIILKEGEYELTSPIIISNENGGTKDLKIIFKADVNAHPIISGGRKVVLKGEGVLYENIASLLKEYKTQPYDIYINGKRGVRARTPNGDFFRIRNPQEVKDSVRLGKNNATQSYEMPLDLYQNLKTLSDSQLKKVRFNIYHKWDNTMRSIDSLDKNKPVFYSTGVAWEPWNKIDEKSTFYLENYAKALDAPNEWFFDGTSLQYIPEQLKVKQQEIVIPVLEQLLIIKGDNNESVSNLSFQGIAFYYTNLKPFAEFVPTQAASSIDAAIMLDNARAITFEDCTISHTAQYGIWLRKNVKDCSISHCYIEDLGAGGVRIGETNLSDNKDEYSSNNKIENNIIHSGGYNFPCAVGVFIAHSGNNIISHNDIGDFRYSGVSVGWIWGYAYSPAVNNKIRFNHIHHIGWGVLSDMAAIYTLGVSDGTEINNNVIHDVYSYDYGGWGLYTDEGSSNIRIENNIVYNTKTGGFHQHYGENNVINNNIIAFNDKYQAQFTRVEKHHSLDFKHNILISDKGVMLQGPWKKGNIDIDYNCYWNLNDEKFVFMDKISTLKKWKRKSGKDRHSISEEPGFVNAKEHDFKFKDLSVVTKIGFKPFNIDEAGVFGEESWKKKAELSDEIITAFKVSVAKNRLP